jgi:hypothetical protein
MRLLVIVLLILIPVVSASFPSGSLLDIRGVGQVRWVLSDELSIPLAAIEGAGTEVSVHWTLNSPRLTSYAFDTGSANWGSTLSGSGFGAALAVARSTGRVAVAYGDFFKGIPIEVAVYDAESPSPRWTRSVALSTFGVWRHPLDISDDGKVVALAYRVTGEGTKYLSLFSGETGEPYWTRQLPGAGNWAVLGVNLAKEGNRIMVGLGDRVLFFDRAGAMLGEVLSATCCQARSFSADGTRALINAGGAPELLEWDGDSYATRWRGQVSPLFPFMQTLSPDGEIVAVYASSIFCETNRVLIFRPPSVMPYSTYSAYGQDACPSSLAFSLDGRRLVVGTLGTVEDREEPADYLRDVATVLDTTTPVVPLPLFRLLDDIDEKGSVTKVGISDNGKRVVVSTKEVHEFVSGNGGRVWGIELLV